jgi:hypothetical protein
MLAVKRGLRTRGMLAGFTGIVVRVVPLRGRQGEVCSKTAPIAPAAPFTAPRFCQEARAGDFNDPGRDPSRMCLPGDRYNAPRTQERHALCRSFSEDLPLPAPPLRRSSRVTFWRCARSENIRGKGEGGWGAGVLFGEAATLRLGTFLDSRRPLLLRRRCGQRHNRHSPSKLSRAPSQNYAAVLSPL